MDDRRRAAPPPIVPPELLDGVIEQFRPQRVVLFGSRARGDARPDSDIDLLVVVDDDLPPERRSRRAASEVARRHDGAVDILPWRRSGYDAERGVVGSLPWTVDREGVVVYGPEIEPVSGDPDGMRVRLADRWVEKAGRDLLAARYCLDGETSLVDSAAYHCQQCAEKLIKGCLILAETPFPKTHDLARLIGRLPASFPAGIRAAMARVEGLSGWAVAGRYPEEEDGEDHPPPPTAAAVEAALETLRALVAKVVAEAA